MNHTYRDFSKVPPPPNYTPPTKIDDMTFAEKVHSILARPEFANAISWMPHGRAFKVHVPKECENNVLPIYFGHGRCKFVFVSLLTTPTTRNIPE